MNELNKKFNFGFNPQDVKSLRILSAQYIKNKKLVNKENEVEVMALFLYYRRDDYLNYLFRYFFNDNYKEVAAKAIYKYPFIVNSLKPEVVEYILLYTQNFLARYIECIKKDPSLILDAPRPICESQEFIETVFNDKDLVSRFEPEWFDMLPYGLYNLDVVKEAFNRSQKVYNKKGIDREGYTSEWKDSGGNIKEYFHLRENFPIKDRQDYVKIFETYLRSELSANQFCAAYGIDNVEGFRDFIDRMGKENLTGLHRVKEIRSAVSKRFFATQIHNIRRILNDELTFEEFFSEDKSSYDLSLDDLLTYFSYEDRNIATKKFLDYSNTMSKDQLSNKYLRLLGIYKMESESIVNAVNKLRGHLILPQDKEYSRVCALLIKEIERHCKPLNRKMIYSKVNIKGVEFTIDDALINTAIEYARKNKIHITNRAILNLCKSIGLGKINPEEALPEHDELVEKINRLIEEDRDIDDYLNLMEEESTTIRL